MKHKFKVLVAFLSSLIVLVVLGSIYLFNIGSVSNPNDCLTNPWMNYHRWTGTLITKNTLSGNHSITVVSYKPYFSFRLNNQDLFASKLQELGLWDENGVLNTSTHRYTSAKHLCILVSPVEQSSGKYVNMENNTVFQSSSTDFEPSTETLMLSIHFDPRFYKAKELSSSEFSYSVSYGIMSAIFDFTSRRDGNKADSSETPDRISASEAFLSQFKHVDDDLTEPVFRVTNIKW